MHHLSAPALAILVTTASALAANIVKSEPPVGRTKERPGRFGR
jgi:hypothetical protein